MKEDNWKHNHMKLSGHFIDKTRSLNPDLFYKMIKSELNDKQIQQHFELIPIKKNSDADIESLHVSYKEINEQVEKILIIWQNAKEDIVSRVLKELLKREPMIDDFKKVEFTSDTRGDHRYVRFTFEGIFIGTLYFNYPGYDTDVDLVERFTIRFTPSPTFC